MIKEYEIPSKLSREEINDRLVWWQQKEFSAIKRSAFETTEEIKYGDESFADVIERRSYKETLKAVHRTSHLQASQKLKKMDKSLAKDIEFWFTVGHARRGLEKFILEEIRAERERRRLKVITGVLFIQRQCYEIGMCQDQQDRLMRVTSERLTRAAQHLAQAYAKADAAAAQSMFYEPSPILPPSSSYQDVALLLKSIDKFIAKDANRIPKPTATPKSVSPRAC